MVNIVTRNVHLPTDPGYGQLSQNNLIIVIFRTRIESLILSSQISTERVDLGDDSVSLSFNIQLVYEHKTHTVVYCVAKKGGTPHSGYIDRKEENTLSHMHSSMIPSQKHMIFALCLLSTFSTSDSKFLQNHLVHF